jgi:beta-lactamase regulating signal transducer with metallopeptidase domain
MDNLLLYLLKVSSGTIIFYLCYILFFSADTFYLRNRIYLLMSLILSVVIPLLRIFNVSPGMTAFEPVKKMNDIILSGTLVESALAEKVSSFNLNHLLVWLYFLIAGLLLLRVIVSVTKAYSIITRGTLHDSAFPKIIISDMAYPPFSFFPFVVIPRSKFESSDYPEILKHENAHVRQGHTFDLILSEVLIAFLWFNPFIWLIKRSIVLNHEYLADNFSIKNSGSKKEYQYKLLNIPKGMMLVPLAHNYSSLIRRRIIMLNKNPTNNYAALKNIIIFPVVATLLELYSCETNEFIHNNGHKELLFSKYSESEIPDSLGNASSDSQNDQKIQVFLEGYIPSDTISISNFLMLSKLTLNSPEYSIVSFTMLISSGGWDYEDISNSNNITANMKKIISEIAKKETKCRYIGFKDIIVKKPKGEDISLSPVFYVLKMK